MTDDDEPELAGYVPTEGVPRRRRMRFVLRIVVVVGIACLVLPGMLTTLSVASSTAQEACNAWVGYEAPEATRAQARRVHCAFATGWAFSRDATLQSIVALRRKIHFMLGFSFVGNNSPPTSSNRRDLRVVVTQYDLPEPQKKVP